VVPLFVLHRAQRNIDFPSKATAVDANFAAVPAGRHQDVRPPVGHRHRAEWTATESPALTYNVINHCQATTGVAFIRPLMRRLVESQPYCACATISRCHCSEDGDGLLSLTLVDRVTSRHVANCDNSVIKYQQYNTTTPVAFDSNTA